ncbi:MAG TPA: DegT/DnrJ/EryC1/StrS family aminotransferase [Candidatus Paceibacterota bacterium]|nr:DegT/DnrJ/EryC1/StrS family aminotransferase [Verrucomicrobiota bacterium]HOX04387.1 DegT/DnrJ/EryC1/StrS family aminotransferase [Verrucomicrobiota bacterium]HRZ47318.1 DegT/DnrJ/EryC1/StrS family aminotransferase [Candidatus Paceibacterota bacterium]HRZ93264.1 DegT/DnrJ/EryC1/StrS family aminotransferase [Candidatus Paceibacterota bacterium]
MNQHPHVSRREFLAATSTAIAALPLAAADAGPGSSTLAIDGGSKAVPQAMPKPKRWGEPELAQLAQAIQQPSLYYWRNKQTALFTQRYQKIYGHKFVQPCSSGSAALHIAVGAAGIGPGDEVITSSITDIGTVIGVIFQNAVPVFAELDPHTYCLDPHDVESKITPRTKAIIAVHLSGNPFRLAELKEIADRHKLILIEDCAQAWGALYRGKPVGTVGQICCFSLQDTKHIACGDGGVVSTSDPRLGPLLIKYGDKAMNRLNPADSSNVIACNYRMTELQAAFVAAQLTRLEEIAARRSWLGELLTAELAGVAAIAPPKVDPRDRCVHWAYMCRLVPEKVRCDRPQFVKALAAEGVVFTNGYIATPIYGMPMFRNHSFFAGRWPIKEAGLTVMDYAKVKLPVTEAIISTCMRFPLNEAMDEDYIRAVAGAVRKVARHYAA